MQNKTLARFAGAWLIAAASILAMAHPACAATVAGTLPADTGVTAAGAPVYTIPIEATTGIGELTPHLSVSYFGSGERSIIGVGFGLAGLSAITACPRTIAQDGTAGPVSLTSADRYCLDGVRLRLVSGTPYGAGNTVYRTEVDQLARITVSTASYGRPDWFQVETRDGLTYEYGNSTDSKFKTGTGSASPTQIWAISKIIDAAGNSILFQYENDATLGRFRPLLIRYTDKAGLTDGHYKIAFVYQGSDRLDTVLDETPSLAGDADHLETRLLERLDLKHDDVVYKQYFFNYGTGAGTNSRLTSMQGCVPNGAGGNDCLPTTTFGWDNATAGHNGLTTNGATVPNANVFALDYNGDGFDDLVWSNGSTWWRMAGGASGYGTATNTTYASTNPAKARVLDWNGDGRMDLLIDWSDSKFRVLAGTATGLASPVPAGPGTGIPSNTANSVFWIVDMNGDGRDDLLRANTGVWQKFWVRLNSPTGFGAETVALDDPTLKVVNGDPFDSALTLGRNAVRRVDFNGDGLEDLLMKACEWDPETKVCTWMGWFQVLSTGSAYEVGYNLYIATTIRPTAGDFNADRLTDVAFPGGSSWCFALATGDGAMQIYCGPSTSGYLTYLTMTADYDGDGYDDLYAAKSAGTLWEVIRSTGSAPASSAITTGLSAAGGGWTVTDYNGDGLPDLARYDTGTFAWGTLAHAGAPGERLNSAVNGLGNSVAFSYLPMSNATVYTRGSTATYPQQDYQSSAALVRTLQMSPGGGTSYALSYAYAGARLDTQGRGYLGMGSHTVTDGRNGIYATETYKQDFPYIGAIETVTTKQPPLPPPSNQTIESIANSYAMHTLDATPYNERYLPYRSQSVTNAYEVGGVKNGNWITQITDSRTVNTLGNTTAASIVTVDKDLGSAEYGQSYTTAIAATYSEDQINWCLAVPTSRSETRTIPGVSPETHSTTWTVDGLYCRATQEVIEPNQGSSLSLVTDLNYDTCGNLNFVSSYPAGVPAEARTTTLNYGTRCQRPESVTNPLNQASTIVYNWPLAAPSTQTDPNGIALNLEYDGFGRLTRQLRPDGTAARFTLTACDASNSWCGKNSSARLKVTRTERDTLNSLLRTDEQFLDGYGRVRWSHSDSLESGPSIIETLYDAFGRPSQQTQPYFAAGAVYSTSFLRDLVGRITQVNAPISEAIGSGRITSFDYKGRELTITDPKSNQTTRRSNVIGQLRAIVDPSPGGTTTHTYTPFGEIASITDAASNVTNWTYNLRDFVIGTTDPDAGSWTYLPNAFGELTSQTDAKSQIVNFTYDKLSRPLTRAEAEGTTNFTWGNSAAAWNIGRLASISSPGSYSENYVFDNKERLSQQTVTADGTAYLINLTYNLQTGLLDTLQYPTSTSGYRLKLAYDYSNNQLQKVRDFNGSTIFWQATSTDAFGHIQNESFGNGVLTFTDFDQASGLMSAREGGVGGGTGLINSQVAWDLNGNLAQRKDLKLSPTITEDFYYDSLNRFDSSQRTVGSGSPAINQDVTLDAIGNLLWKKDVCPSGANCYSYHTTKKRAVISAGSYSFGYDANGNLTSRNGSSIGYTSYNLPNGINAGSNSSTISYGAFRNRYKQVAVASGVTETTIYVSGLLEKMTKGSVTEYRHLIDGGNGPAAIYTRRSSGTPLTDTYYLHGDHLGSPELITDANGAPVVRPSFGAYGERRDGSDWDGPVSAPDLTAIGNTTRHGFTGHEWPFPDFPDTEVRWDDDLGGVRWEGGHLRRSSSTRRSSWC